MSEALDAVALSSALALVPPATEAQRRAEAIAEHRFAIEHFGTRIREGKLTVVGAVYDFRNDRKHGAGKLEIVNVNVNGNGYGTRSRAAPRRRDLEHAGFRPLLESFGR